MALSLGLFGCTSVEDAPTEDDLEETAMVILAEEGFAVPSEALPLQATFTSDSGAFEYSFDYDGNFLKLVAGKFEGASEKGASFMAEGNVEVVTATYLASEFEAELLEEFTLRDGDCDVFGRTVLVEDELLVIQARQCEGDAPVAAQAVQELFAGLRF